MCARAVDATARGTLYRCALGEDEPLVLVRVANSTPESDGSAKAYLLRVPPAVETVDQALAWGFGFERAVDYSPAIET